MNRRWAAHETPFALENADLWMRLLHLFGRQPLQLRAHSGARSGDFAGALPAHLLERMIELTLYAEEKLTA